MYALPLADEMFLIGHDGYSGKPLISDSALDTVLAGAILGELIFAQRIGIREDNALVPYDQRPIGDRVCDPVLVEVLKQNETHTVRAWVEHLRDNARTPIALRLVRTGLVDRVEARAMLKTTIRYPARDRIAAAGSEARLRYMLDHPGNLDEQTATMAGLVLAGGLEFLLGGASGREIKERLLQMAQMARPDMRFLMAGVESAVAALAMSARR
jgi:hypothetical protein